jgi:hypothetical protein
MSVADVEETVMAWKNIDEDTIQELIRRHHEKMDEAHYEAAVRRLRGYAVGVGEAHHQRRARDVTMRLIRHGFVRRLFLECNSNEQEKLNGAVSQPKSTSNYQSAIADLVSTAGPQYPNEVPLGEVATVALKHLVPVHYIDLDIRNKPHWKNLEKRDAPAAERFRAITKDTGTVGCLILFGAHHFNGDKEVYKGEVKCLGELLDLGYVDFGPPPRVSSLSQ